MDQPTDDHHLKDLGSTDGTHPVAADLDSRRVVQDAGSPARTAAGAVGLEDSPADTPLADDRFAGGPPSPETGAPH